MNESIQPIAQELREARKKKGFSQRELSARVGLPQSHISKIESGLVDLQVSSLIQLARVLNLELMLVPCALTLAVKALSGKGGGRGGKQVAAYRLEEEDDGRY